MPTAHVVKLHVNGSSLTVTPDSLVVDHGDTVDWYLEPDGRGSWLVSFVDGSGFDVETPTGGPPATPGQIKKGQKAKAKQTEGEFAYRVAVCANGEVAAVFDCPSIIIRRAIAPRAALELSARVLKPAIDRLLDAIPTQGGSKLFPNGITLIDASVNLATTEFKLKIEGPGKPPNAPAKRGA